MRAAVVSAAALAEVAAELELGDALLLGKGESASGGREKPSILADALEAVIGAVYLDGGWAAAARRWCMSLLGDRIAAGRRGPGRPGLQDPPPGAGGPPLRRAAPLRGAPTRAPTTTSGSSPTCRWPASSAGGARAGRRSRPSRPRPGPPGKRCAMSTRRRSCRTPIAPRPEVPEAVLRRRGRCLSCPRSRPSGATSSGRSSASGSRPSRSTAPGRSAGTRARSSSSPGSRAPRSPAVGRTGKYLVLKLDTGDLLVIHLRHERPAAPGPGQGPGAEAHPRRASPSPRAASSASSTPAPSASCSSAARTTLAEEVPELAELGFDPVDEPMSWVAFGELLLRRRQKLKAFLHRPDVHRRARQHLLRRDPLPGRAALRPHARHAVARGDAAALPGAGRDAARGDQAPRARRWRTSSTSTSSAGPATTRSSTRCTTAKARPAAAAARRSCGSSSSSGRRSSARTARSDHRRTGSRGVHQWRKRLH